MGTQKKHTTAAKKGTFRIGGCGRSKTLIFMRITFTDKAYQAFVVLIF